LWITNGGNNETGFASPDYDLLVRAAGNIPGCLERSEAILGAVKARDSIAKLIEAEGGAESPVRRRARAELRMALLSEAERMLVNEEFPVVPIYFYLNSGLLSPKVEGLYPMLQMPDGSEVPNLQAIHPLYAVEKLD